MEFDWDDGKAGSNLAKHGVPFPYATRVFLDEGRVDLDATRPADDEARRKVTGVMDGRLFTVVYTVRGQVIRLISARRSNSREEKSYGPIHP